MARVDALVYPPLLQVRISIFFMNNSIPCFNREVVCRSSVSYLQAFAYCIAGLKVRNLQELKLNPFDIHHPQHPHCQPLEKHDLALSII